MCTLKANSQHRTINTCWLGLLSAFCIARQATVSVCVALTQSILWSLIRLESHIPKGQMKRAAEPTRCEMSGKVTGAWWEKICFRDDMFESSSCPWRRQNLCFINPRNCLMGSPHSFPAALLSRLKDLTVWGQMIFLIQRFIPHKRYLLYYIVIVIFFRFNIFSTLWRTINHSWCFIFIEGRNTPTHRVTT